MHSPVTSRTELERPRLLQKLQRAAELRLTIVTAAPGYGKTTALAPQRAA